MKSTVVGIADAWFDVHRPGGGETKLSWRRFPAGERGFFRAPVLLCGVSEALLIDGGFTYADGLTLVEVIKASGKKLTTIYISQSHPDYYFSLKPVTEAFPDAQVIAAVATVETIWRTVEKKLALWGPQLKENGPQTLADIVVPEVFDGSWLSVDGETIQIVNAAELANRRYLWVPSIEAVFGGALIYSGVHVWTADTPSKAQREAWIASLDKLASREPAIVVAGHTTLAAPTDMSGIQHTRDYLTAFEEELSEADGSAALKAAMEARFPDLGMGVALEIGSKVATGEMRWN